MVMDEHLLFDPFNEPGHCLDTDFGGIHNLGQQSKFI